MENESPSDSPFASDQGEQPFSEIGPCEDEDALEGSADIELPVLNANPSIEILVDGSDLLTGAVGSNGLEISILFEKTHEDEGHHNELADQLEGVELRVSLDSTDGAGVELVSSGHGGEAVLPPEDSTLHPEVPQISTDANHLTVCENVVQADNVIVDCVAQDESESGEKKRHREGEEEVGRCLKPKSMEDDCGNRTDLIRGRMETHIPDDHAQPHGSLSDMHCDNKDICFNENSSQETRTIGDENHTLVGTVLKGTEGSGVDEGGSGETVVATANDVEDKVSNEKASLDGVARVRPRKRRKIAMLLAYCGAGYQGMQKNPGAVTIEGEFEAALIKAGAMPDNYDGNPRKVDWMRAARTDKGVSAVGQVVSGLFYVDPPNFVERVNEHLPKQIRLLGYKRVTPTFSAKKFCDRRRYEYAIPIFALDSSTHRDREAVLASGRKDVALEKCVECSERGRKVPAGKKMSRQGTSDIAMANDCDGQRVASDLHSAAAVNKEKVMPSTVSTNEAPFERCQSPHSIEESDASSLQEMPTEGKFFLNGMEEHFLSDGKEREVSMDYMAPQKNAFSFQFGEPEREKLNGILRHYVGTHNFHNFTSRVKAEDPSAKRYIVSFEAGNVFTIGNIEFVRCTIVGQSFMLHQIRKMVGLAIAVFRGCAPESILETALRRDANITVPTAPELGLFLDECMYPVYNQKWYDTHEEVSQRGFEEEIECFKNDVIYPHIAATENKEGQMALFLHSLNDRNYADFAAAQAAAEGASH